MDTYTPTEVNDVHSRLNATRVAGVLTPRDVGELVALVKRLRDQGKVFAVSGGRHAMGGQQFAGDSVLLDMRGMCRLVSFDDQKGLATFEAGAAWPHIVREIRGRSDRWGIRQKQTGADDLTLGGAVSANGHGRGLTMGPIVDDVEEIELINADGVLVTCSRTRNAELFALAVGGYGLFGVIATVTLRLSSRQKLKRLVDILDVDEALVGVRRKVENGCIYGDFQYAIDPSNDSFLRRGVFACYAPAGETAEEPDPGSDLKPEQWGRLLQLAHTDKPAAFAAYSQHYLASHGRVYWSDVMQLSTYIPSYDQFLKETTPHSLVIGELYVPPDALPEFLARSRRILREHNSENIYGTIRSILADRTTFLAWAKQDYACIIFNLRTSHAEDGIGKTRATFQALNAAALDFGGSFFLTYHRYASRDQIEQAYPQFQQFLSLKRQHDPQGLFTSDWYRYYEGVFGGGNRHSDQ